MISQLISPNGWQNKMIFLLPRMPPSNPPTGVKWIPIGKQTHLAGTGRWVKKKWTDWTMTWLWKFMQFVMQKMQFCNILAWICGNFPKFELFFSCTENFSKTKSPKKCFYSIIAQKNLNANFWKHVILIKSQVSLRPYDEKKTQLFINITCFQKLPLRFFWAIIE